MAMSALAGCQSANYAHFSGRRARLFDGQTSAYGGIKESNALVNNRRRNFVKYEPGSSSCRQFRSIRCAMDAQYGDSLSDSSAVFPRINVADPYKRLGISREASEEEILSARNFLIQRYAGHKPSVDAIEKAHDKIIMQMFNERKRPKLHIMKKVRVVTQHPYVLAVINRFRTPSTKFIVLTAVAYLSLGLLTVKYPTEDGPTLQVAISLLATMYFVYHRLKNKLRAVLYGAGAFVVSWFLGTLLMVSVIPPILKGPRSLEVTTSLISYVLLWVTSTYIR